MHNTESVTVQHAALDRSALLADWRGALARIDELEARRDLSEAEFEEAFDRADANRLAVQATIAETPAIAPAAILAKVRVLGWQLDSLLGGPGEPLEEEKSAFAVLASISRDLEALARSVGHSADVQNVSQTTS